MEVKNILTKKEFCDIMDSLKKIREAEKQHRELIESFNQSEERILPSSLNFGFLEDELVKTLKAMFFDYDEWISYFLYELDFGAKYTHGCITMKTEGEEVKYIDLSTSEKLYDFLIKEINRL